MKPSKSLILRMGVRYKRLSERNNAELVRLGFPDLQLHIHTHDAFQRMIGFAAALFPEADFRWLMRFEDIWFLDDVGALFANIDPQTGGWLAAHTEPRFVSRSRAEADRAAKRGNRKGGAK